MPMSGRKALKIMKQLDAAMEDPMTVAMGAGEHVSQFYGERFNMDEVANQAHIYLELQYAKRNKFKDPARMRWLATRTYERMARTEQAEGSRS